MKPAARLVTGPLPAPRPSRAKRHLSKEPDRERDASSFELGDRRHPKPRGVERADDLGVGRDLATRNLKMSCSVTTSDSIRWTSVIAVTRREPSSSRSRCTIRSSADETCCLIARTAGRSRPSAPSSRSSPGRRAASSHAPSRASRRDPCSSPGACRAPPLRGPRRR